MASSSADPSISSPAPGTVVREAATRDHLWQVPVFFAGLVTLFWVWNCRPFCLDSTARRIERQLSEARDLLTRPEGDAENALRLALAALESSDSLPDRAGEAAFLAGWAYIRQAERADPIESRQAWQQAQEYLNQAQRNQVSDTDEPLMKYRQAKVAFHLGEPLPRVIEMLEDAVPKADLQAEGYSLLAQAYLKLPQPDLGQALTANQKLRDVTEATEAELIQARLQGGEILLRMGKMEEARKTLEKIPDQAPAGIVARSRRIRARTFQEEKQWGEAIRLYQAALADSRVPPADQSTIYFNLGLCYRNLEQPQEAARAWQECLKPGGGPESQAAAFYLGELRLHEQAYEQAVYLLSESVANVGKPLVWKNPIVSLQNARDLFEKALKQLRQVARYDLADKLVNVYANISGPRRVLRLQGEINLEWGRALQETEKQNPDNLKTARARYQAAGEACSKLVELPGLPVAEQGEFIWTAAQAFILAQATDQAIQRLEQAVKHNLEPQRLGEAWFRLAELYRSKGKKPEALAAFAKCMEHDTRFAYLARFQLAMARLEAGDLDEAEAALVYNLKMLRWESDPEAMSQSLFALGSLLYKRRDYRRVVRYLEDALGRFQDNPEVTKARFQLADSYRQIAAQENQSYLLGETMSAETRSHFQREHRRWLQKAADEFAALDRLLETEAGKQHFNAEMRAQVPFISAKCWFNLGQYEKSLTVYEKLIDRYLGKVEVLDALGGAVSCHAALGQVDKVKQRLLQIKTTLPKIEEPVRGPWERWLVEALKPLSEL